MIGTKRQAIFKTTCPRDCYDSCGMLVVVEDGKIRAIKGDQSDPVSQGYLCGKCALAYNGVWIDPNKRLLRPMKRVGQKGFGQMIPVTWNEALTDIAGHLRNIYNANAAKTILHTHYTGTCSLIAGHFPLRFFNRLGATEVDPDTICNKAGHEALKYVFGTSSVSFDPRTGKNANCLLIWGANPSTSAPHIYKHWIAETPGRKIVIDPIAHKAARDADLFLQLRPGSDAALAFAMMAAAQAAGLLNEHFVAEHVLGWDAISREVRAMTPERATRLTGVAGELIQAAAQLYAKGPSLLWLGQGMQRQPMGGNAFRAVAALCAVTGNIGAPGTGLLFINGPSTRGLDLDYLTAPHLSEKSVPPISHMDLVSRLSDASKSRALFCWNNNIVASSPAQRKLCDALSRDDLFTVAIDLFLTDTTDYADYVLPAASFLEFDDLLLPYFNNSVSAVVKAVNPFGESLPNQEIFRRLAKLVGFEESELFEPDATIIDNLLHQVGWHGDFASLAAHGTFYPSAKPRIPFEKAEFPTPSGKIEIASKDAARNGHPLTPIPHADEPMSNGRLRVLSPASEWTVNSCHANDARVGARLGLPPVLLNKYEATRRGIAEGDIVMLHNECGRLLLKVKISSDVPEGVVLVHKGRWPKLDPNYANVNALNPGNKTDMGESTSVHGIYADIELFAELSERASFIGMQKREISRFPTHCS